MFYILYKKKEYSVSRDVYYSLIKLQEKNDYAGAELLLLTSDDVYEIKY